MQTELVSDMIYFMSPDQQATQIGQLMLDKKAAEDRLSSLVKQAKDAGGLLTEVGRMLASSPEVLSFPRQEVQMRFRTQMVNGKIPSDEELRTLVAWIREEMVKISGYADSLKNFGL